MLRLRFVCFLFLLFLLFCYFVFCLFLLIFWGRGRRPGGGGGCLFFFFFCFLFYSVILFLFIFIDIFGERPGARGWRRETGACTVCGPTTMPTHGPWSMELAYTRDVVHQTAKVCESPRRTHPTPCNLHQQSAAQPVLYPCEHLQLHMQTPPYSSCSTNVHAHP